MFCLEVHISLLSVLYRQFVCSDVFLYIYGDSHLLHSQNPHEEVFTSTTWIAFPKFVSVNTVIVQISSFQRSPVV